jgi:transcriptional regulator with XRE-family HTH domain
MEDTQLNIGDKVKDLRESKGLTGYQLAQKAGITEARLMAYEAGYATPTIATLMKISQALGVGMGFFFQDQAPPKRVEVVRADERKPMQKSDEENEIYYTYHSLSPTFPEAKVQPFFVEIDLVEESKVQPAVHPGEEFLYVLEGTVEWRGGEENHRLGPGDAIHYDSGIAHRIIAVGDKKPKVLSVVYQPPSGS